MSHEFHDLHVLVECVVFFCCFDTYMLSYITEHIFQLVESTYVIYIHSHFGSHLFDACFFCSLCRRWLAFLAYQFYSLLVLTSLHRYRIHLQSVGSGGNSKRKNLLRNAQCSCRTEACYAVYYFFKDGVPSEDVIYIFYRLL